MFRLSVFLLLFYGAFGFTDILVLTENMPPYNYKEGNEIQGISAELVKAVFAHAELEYEHRMVPWKRGYSIALSRKNTFLYSTIRINTRESQFKWIGPLYTDQFFFYKLKRRDDIQVRSFEDLKKYVIGVPDEDFSHQYLKEQGFTASQVRPLLDYERALPMLYRSHLDILVNTSSILKHRLKRYSDYAVEDLERVYELPNKKTFYIAVNIQTDDALVARLQEALDTLVAQGICDQIIAK